MNRPVAPIRREEARLPEAGSTMMRRYALLSLVLHVGVAGLSLISFPALRRHDRVIYAPRIYEVALVPAPIPNYEPPIPQPQKRKEPIPLKPVVKAETTKPKPKTEEPKERSMVKSAEPAKTKPPAPATGTSEKPQSATTTSSPQEHPVSLGQVDQANFHQDYYLETIRSILVRLWDPPTGGNGLHQASVHFIVQKDGTITSPVLTADSGWPLYDRSAMSAVVAALHKLPPLPEGYEGSELGLTVNFQRLEEAQP
jgi:outer membrane biosynthesis protein TonB